MSPGFGAVNGHLGFQKFEIAGETTLDSHAYAHYLHHKYFEVNYGGDGLIPLDRWFGTWHDGTKEGDALMDARFRKKKERMNARAPSATGTEKTTRSREERVRTAAKPVARRRWTQAGFAVR